MIRYRFVKVSDATETSSDFEAELAASGYPNYVDGSPHLGAITGMICESDYCDKIATREISICPNSLARSRLLRAPVDDCYWYTDGPFPNGDGTVTGHKCEQDYIVTAIKCEDDYCGRLTLRCNKLLNQGRWIQGSEYRTKQFSEEDGGEKRCLTGESALVGIECYSGYCDNKELICMKISNISW